MICATIFAFLTFLMLMLNCRAYVEMGENYVMFDIREYDGDSDLPYGKGSNGNCYYPRIDGSDYVFPEIYTWSHGTLDETGDGVRLYATKKGGNVSITVDKVPPVYQQSVQRNFRYFQMRLKANTTGTHKVTYSSLGNIYRKNVDVNFTGEWQIITIDLAGSDGWTQKASDGSYIPVTTTPWDSGHFGTDGFAIMFAAFGDDILNDIYIDYFAFAENPDTELKTGKLVREEAYIEGKTDGLFYPSEKLTRAQACAIVSRILEGEKQAEIPNDFTTSFTDVSADDWFYPYVVHLESLGALSRFECELLPDRYITVSELGSILINSGLTETEAGGLDYAGNTSLLSDIGDMFNDLSPNHHISRAQACTLINTVTGRSAVRDCSDEFYGFDVVSPDYWAFGDIVGASVSKDLKILSDGTRETVALLDKADYDKTAMKIAEIDILAENLKKSIIGSKTEIVSDGKCYYVSPKGNDSNSGTSPNSPWKTLKKVNAVGFTAGSTVYFERGGLWRGTLQILPNVTYSAYGEGEKPTFYGSLYDGADSSLWTLVDGTENIWKFKYDMLDCGSVVFNHGEFHSDKETPSYKDGVYLHRNSSKEFDFKKDISENLGIFCDNKKELSKECPLYLRCDGGNPGELFDSIEFMPRQNILNVVANQNVLIDNFCIMYGGAHGVGAGTVKNITVRNCEFMWIGGSIHTYNSGGGIMPVRYGNAIECYGSPDGYTVENNYIYQVYDAGITHQLGENNDGNGVQKNIRYANNLIEFCSYSVEYFLGKRADGSVDRYMENIVIENNIMRYAGFGFGNQRTDRLCMSHIKTSGTHFNAVSEGFVIRNNIFDRSREMLLYIGAEKAEDLPVLENNVYIQYETKPETPYSTFGYYGAHPARLKFFSRYLRSILMSENIEENPQIYFAKKDWLYDLPES